MKRLFCKFCLGVLTIFLISVFCQVSLLASDSGDSYSNDIEIKASKATWNPSWKTLSQDIDNILLGKDIIWYRIKWYSGSWSPKYYPGHDDLDWKDSKRRVWAYFYDHEFEYAVRKDENLEIKTSKPDRKNQWYAYSSGQVKRIIGKDIVWYRIKWSEDNWSPKYFPGYNDVDSKLNPDHTVRRMWAYFYDHEFEYAVIKDKEDITEEEILQYINSSLYEVLKNLEPEIKSMARTKDYDCRELEIKGVECNPKTGIIKVDIYTGGYYYLDLLLKEVPIKVAGNLTADFKILVGKNEPVVGLFINGVSECDLHNDGGILDNTVSGKISEAIKSKLDFVSYVDFTDPRHTFFQKYYYAERVYWFPSKPKNVFVSEFDTLNSDFINKYIDIAKKYFNSLDL